MLSLAVLVQNVLNLAYGVLCLPEGVDTESALYRSYWALSQNQTEGCSRHRSRPHSSSFTSLSRLTIEPHDILTVLLASRIVQVRCAVSCFQVPTPSVELYCRLWSELIYSTIPRIKTYRCLWPNCSIRIQGARHTVVSSEQSV